ncbi:MAG: hypothetical protein LBR13_01735 [Dysgonamonadaceae bacterium]|jgi:hypothetical protein|nr:hypothetical protein [Dysgonamonadaceae bacterium]
MNTKQMNNTIAPVSYAAPEIEILTVAVEQGFQASTPDDLNDSGEEH